jgi:exodeoxyribonuclease V alpha subunit
MIDTWTRAGVFGSAERHGAAVLCRADDSGDELVPLAAALALWAPLHGHACVDLATVRETVQHELAAEGLNGDAGAVEVVDRLSWPSLGQWLESLAATPVCRVVAESDLDSVSEPVLDDRPLVLRGTMLSTQRQWADECIVSADLRRRAIASPAALDPSTAAMLDGLLAAGSRQHAAAVMAATSRLAVIVGGPGTGKTHTIARLLMALRHQAATNGTPLRIALAAPTGKAAARMADALSAADPDGGAPDVRPTTVHRLLGPRWQQTRFAHGPEHLLDADVVVIDEASMVALPLMARLVEALDPSTRLVLVGDPDQLESIEVGAVLADVVAAADVPGSPLAASVVRLDRPHRQAAGSPIGPLADAIRLGRDDGVMALLGSGVAGLRFVDTGPFGLAGAEQAVREAVLPALRRATDAARAGDAANALEAFAEVRVLCAHRTGPYGVQRWNRIIESWLGSDDRDRDRERDRGRDRERDRERLGRPLLATRNDARLRVANGDTGIVVATAAGPRAAFGTAGGIRLLAAAQLDAVETAYAMTVHKSQGSEYPTVVLVLPPATSPLIGRELLYTAVTRASDQVVVVGDEAAVRACVRTPGRRVTGLASALSRPLG